MKAALRFFTACLVCVALFSCSSQSVAPLHIGTNVWPGYSPLYLARQLQYFDDTEVRLTEYASATEVMDALREQRLDAAALTMDEVLSLDAEGVDLVVVLVMDVSTGGDAIVARQGIKSMKGLRGKRIGVEDRALGRYFLARACDMADVDREDMQIIPVSAGHHEAALLNGRVDAVVTYDPMREHLVRAGATVLFDSNRIPGEIVDVLAVRRQVLMNESDQIRDLLQQWFRAVDFLNAKPRDAALHMKKQLHMDIYDIMAVYRRMHMPDTSENKILLGGNQPALRRTAERMTSVMQAEGLIDKPVRTTMLFAGYPVL